MLIHRLIGRTDTEIMDTSSTSPVKATSKASDQPSSSDFPEFRDQLSSHFTRLEDLLASMGPLPTSQQKPVSLSVRVGVSLPRPPPSFPSGAVSTTPFILQPTTQQ